MTRMRTYSTIYLPDTGILELQPIAPTDHETTLIPSLPKSLPTARIPPSTTARKQRFVIAVEEKERIASFSGPKI